MAWDPNVPATNAPLLSAPIRANFQALDALMGADGAVFPVLAPDGTAAAPTYSFASTPSAGLSLQELNLGGDVSLIRDGPGVLSQRAGATGQVLRIYKDAGTNKYMEFNATGGANNFVSVGATLNLTATGGGLMTLTTDGGTWYLLNTGHIFPATDNALDLGAAGNAVRNLYLGTGIRFNIPAVPGTPPAGTGVLYMKSDKHLYQKNDAGLEESLVGGTGITAMVALTQAAYDALTPKVATTLYVING